MRLVITYIAILVLLGCSSAQKDSGKSSSTGAVMELEYAQCFRVESFPTYKHLTIYSGVGSDRKSFEFILQPRGEAKSQGLNLEDVDSQGIDTKAVDTQGIDTKAVDSKNSAQGNLSLESYRDIPVIFTPIDRYVTLSSTQLPYLTKLNLQDKLVAINSSRYLHNREIKSAIESGRVPRIGREGNFDTEKIIVQNPEVIFVSPFKFGGYDALKGLDLTLLPIASYGETSPLARAEWIKLFGLLFDREQESNIMFQSIKSKYLSLKAMVDSADVERPTIFTGECKAGIWYAVGGKSYLSHYFRDAGADYILDSISSGSMRLDFETVFSKAYKADYWRIVNSTKEFSYSSLLKQDERYSDFKAFEKRGVIYCNMRETPFYEQTPMEPEVVLADFIYALHPTLLPNYSPSYYKHLTE